MCNCGQSWPNCSCTTSCSQPCNPCTSSGCLVKLDATCIIYHKKGNNTTELENLDLPNGTTLELFMNTVDDYIGQIKAGSWSFPVLEDYYEYEINTIQEFATAVDEVLGQLEHFKGNIASADPSDLTDGDYWFRTDLDQLRIQLNGVTRQITIV